MSSNWRCILQELYKLPENLKALRRQYGYTQQYVAEQLGITPQSYHAYEAGITIPSRWTTFWNDMNDLYNLAKNLKALRLQYGYTQKQVAEKLGIATQSYQAYEWGVNVPSLQNFIKLARLYDVSLDDLLE